MDELRMKSKTALSHIFNNQKNIIIFEKNIYDSSLKNLKKYENFEDIYLYNIYYCQKYFLVIKIILFSGPLYIYNIHY